MLFIVPFVLAILISILPILICEPETPDESEIKDDKDKKSAAKKSDSSRSDKKGKSKKSRRGRRRSSDRGSSRRGSSRRSSRASLRGSKKKRRGKRDSKSRRKKRRGSSTRSLSKSGGRGDERSDRSRKDKKHKRSKSKRGKVSQKFEDRQQQAGDRFRPPFRFPQAAMREPRPPYGHIPFRARVPGQLPHSYGRPYRPSSYSQRFAPEDQQKVSFLDRTQSESLGPEQQIMEFPRRKHRRSEDDSDRDSVSGEEPSVSELSDYSDSFSGSGDFGSLCGPPARVIPRRSPRVSPKRTGSRAATYSYIPANEFARDDSPYGQSGFDRIPRGPKGISGPRGRWRGRRGRGRIFGRSDGQRYGPGGRYIYRREYDSSPEGAPYTRKLSHSLSIESSEPITETLEQQLAELGSENVFGMPYPAHRLRRGGWGRSRGRGRGSMIQPGRGKPIPIQGIPPPPNWPMDPRYRLSGAPNIYCYPQPHPHYGYGSPMDVWFEGNAQIEPFDDQPPPKEPAAKPKIKVEAPKKEQCSCPEKADQVEPKAPEPEVKVEVFEDLPLPESQVNLFDMWPDKDKKVKDGQPEDSDEDPVNRILAEYGISSKNIDIDSILRETTGGSSTAGWLG